MSIKKIPELNAKLNWLCSEGHQWDATYESIKNGRWCLKCSGNERLTIDEMRKIAKSHNGKCLSKKYKNAMNKLRWECAERSRRVARASHIKSGSWCPYCVGRYVLSIICKKSQESEEENVFQYIMKALMKNYNGNVKMVINQISLCKYPKR